MDSLPNLSRGSLLTTARRPFIRVQRTRGMTLVEVMIAFSLFMIMAIGTISALLQTRKMSEDNVAQATAAVIAQGIIEQVQVNPYEDIADEADHPSLALRFTGSNVNNLANIQQFSLPWNFSEFREIGALADPTDPDSEVLGVLIDLAYMDGAKIIRPARYMKMQVKIGRKVNAGNHNVQILLTYQWQPPSRNYGTGPEVYLTRELRTIRSQASSF